MTAARNSGFGATMLAAIFLIAFPGTLFANECAGRSDEPLVNLLQPPPCEACEETKAELAELEALEQARTPVEAAHAASDAERTLPRFFEGAGIAFDAAALKNCEGFFMRRRKEERAAVDAAKDTFCRVRPFLTPNNSLHPVQEAKPDASFSYPSGHAAYGATVGFLLAEMMPEKRTAIYARIDGYAHSRMVAGVHYRSDVEAGKLFGAAIVNSLFADPAFVSEFGEAKACVRKAAGLR